MTDPHDSPSDELLDELLAPFRAINVPDDVCISNRHSLRVALASCVRPVWWRRTVAIPVPIAIAATFAFVIAGIGLLRTSYGPSGIIGEMAHPVQRKTIAVTANDVNTHPTWSLTRQYVPSLVASGGIQESLNELTKENGNDS